MICFKICFDCAGSSCLLHRCNCVLFLPCTCAASPGAVNVSGFFQHVSGSLSLWVVRILSGCANFAILCGCSFRLSGILQGFPILSGSIDGSGRPVPDPLPGSWRAGCTGTTPTPSHAHTLAREKALFSEFILNKCAAWVWPFLNFRASLYRGLCAVFRACCRVAVPSRLCSSCQLLPFLLALSNAIYTQSKRYKSTIKAQQNIYYLLAFVCFSCSPAACGSFSLIRSPCPACSLPWSFLLVVPVQLPFYFVFLLSSGIPAGHITILFQLF